MMNKKFLKVVINLIAFTLLALPVLVFAQDNIDQKPLDANAVTSKFRSIVNILAFFAIIGTVIFIIVGGFQWMSGNAKEGGSKVRNGIFGLIIVLVAYLLVQLVAGLVEGVKDSGTITGETTNNTAQPLP